MDTPTLPQALDHAAFGRVWRRVMPQDRPDCPFTLAEPAPAAPSVSLCLGEGSAGELVTLDGLLAQVRAGTVCYRALVRRTGRTSPAGALLRAKMAHGRRLAAARYLIAGEGCPPTTSASPPDSGPLGPLLRARFHAEQALVLALFTAANASADPCLVELYRALAVETQGLADTLRSWLEQII